LNFESIFVFFEDYQSQCRLARHPLFIFIFSEDHPRMDFFDQETQPNFDLGSISQSITNLCDR